MSRPRIILCRHGRPALSRNVLLDWRGYEDWWRQYDEGGLRRGPDGDQPVPPKVAEMARGADVVCASPLPRAMESVRLASGREPDHVLPDMVEAPLPPPRLPGLRARPITWGTISRIAWLGGHCRDCETATEARARARRVAGTLSELAEADGGRTVFVSAHGWFNRMVGNALRRAGWRVAQGRGDGYWSHRIYERPAKRTIRRTPEESP